MDDVDAEGAPLPRVEYPPLAPAPPSAQRVWTVLVAFPLAVLLGATSGLGVLAALTAAAAWRARAAHGVALSGAELRAYGESLVTHPVGLLGGALASSLSFAAMSLVPAALSGDGVVERLRLGARRRWGAWGALAGVGMLGVGAVSGGVMALAGVEHRGELGVIHRAFAGAPLAVTAMALALLGVGAGVGEELFFRGYVQTRLLARWGLWPSVLLSAGLFALAHFDPLHSSFAFAAGALVGWVSARAGTVRVTMVAHVLNNAVSVAAMALARPGERTGTAAAAAEVALGAVMVVACVAGFRRVDPDGV